MKDLEGEACTLRLAEDSAGEMLWTLSYHLPLIRWWLPTQRWAINPFQGSNKQLRPNQRKAAEIRVKYSEMTLHFRRTSWKNPRWREILGRTGILQGFPQAFKGSEILLFSLSHVSYSLRPCGLQHTRLLCPSLSPRVCSVMSIESVMPPNHLVLCRPLLLPPSIFPIIRVFSYESALRIRLPKYWSFSFSVSPSNEYSELISFRIYWIELWCWRRLLRVPWTPRRSNQ